MAAWHQLYTTAARWFCDNWPYENQSAIYFELTSGALAPMVRVIFVARAAPVDQYILQQTAHLRLPDMRVNW